MTRDLLLATLFSLGLHLVLLLGQTTRPERPARSGPDDDTDRIKLIPMPPQLEEPDVVEVAEPDSPPLDLAPPMLPDVPQPPQPDSFLQKVQPPPPERVTISQSMTIVPAVRNPGSFQGIRVFDPAMLDQVPVPKFQPPPQYPFEMRRSGTTGEVMVDFIVDPAGEVRNAFPLRSTHREFEAAAVVAVSRWKFRPGRKDGRAVPTHMQVPIVFRLNEE